MRNIVGQKFDRWTVLSNEGHSKRRLLQVLCECDCGNRKVITKQSLTNGRSKSCGCLQKEKASETKNIGGQMFNRWTVIGEAPRNKHGQLQVLAECDCGTIQTLNKARLTRGDGKSCGCLRKEKVTTHGMQQSRFYKTWQAMKQRCQNEKTAYYHNYGGRGITVCDRWQTFENFRNDLHESYEAHVEEYGGANTSIDRINVNGNYEPSNIRWATWETQARNQRMSSRNTSGHVGVRYYEDRRKWRAEIIVNGKYIFLGRFTDLDMAVAARKAAEDKYWINESIA